MVEQFNAAPDSSSTPIPEGISDSSHTTEINRSQTEAIGEAVIEPYIEASRAVLHETEPKVASFKTAKGSVYTYDADGKTTRYKTAATTESERKQERQDLTVFSKLSLEDEQDYLFATKEDRPDKSKKVYVVEKHPDGKFKVIRDISQVKIPDDLHLVIVKDSRVSQDGYLTGGKFLKHHQASLQPTVGYNAFDTRQYQENGQTFTERHLGNKVVGISYT